MCNLYVKIIQNETVFKSLGADGGEHGYSAVLDLCLTAPGGPASGHEMSQEI